jgi:lipid-A-disaccharide synthase-like uncharacterized protein
MASAPERREIEEPEDRAATASRSETSRLGRRSLGLAFTLGLVAGLVVHSLIDGIARPRPDAVVDARDIGLSWAWLAFGFLAQALFTARMLAQWIATERARSSVVPPVFWWLSLFGGLMLLAYFLRRGDPVGVIGQAFGVVIYARNLLFVRRSARRLGDESGD